MKPFVSSYIGLTMFLLTDLILHRSKGISLPGHMLDWILFWTWILSTFLLLIKYRKIKPVKIYSVALAIFTILTMLPMMIPFITILAFAFDASDQRYRVDENVELMEHFEFAGPAIPKVVAVRSFGFYEKIIGETDFQFEVGDDHLRIKDV